MVCAMPLKRFSVCNKLFEWLKKELLWNWIIRLLLESILEISFALMLQFQYSNPKKSEWGAFLDYGVGIIIAPLLVLLPIFIIVFYNYHFDKLEEDEEFKDKYGTVMEGLDPKKRSSVAYVAMFAVRRILFMCASLFLFKYVIL